jgi:hypothetical protein
VGTGHKEMQAAFQRSRKSLNYANLDSQGSGKYRVKTARQSRYIGASTGVITVSDGH